MAKPIADEGSQETFRTLSAIKGTASDINALTRLAKNYHQSQAAANESSKQLVDHLVKVASKMEPRLSEASQAFIEISSTQKQIIAKMEEHNNLVLEKLCQTIQGSLQRERTELAQFEKGYHKRHGEILTELRKAEKATKKSGKKSNFQLQQAIQDLTDKMNEMTNHRQSKLREILLFERKRYCDIVNLLNGVIDSQMSVYQYSTQTLNDQHQKWKSVAATYNQLPPECQALLERTGVKERTSTAIQGGELSGGGDESYSEYYSGSYDESGYYDENYDESYYEEGYEESYEEAYVAPATGFQARALYDYVGSHDYELSFSAGDIINVTKEDPSTGWWTGELRGVVGPFPGNYVERL